ncbi:hypothetical protein Tco_0109516 [Tanacetum coccineum]
MDFIQKKVGNDENTSFWDDSWLGEVALKVLYKRLYALEMCKSISVAEKMGHPSLSHSFRRMPRGGVEQKNYGLLCSKVADLVLPNISDIWCWYLEGSHEFSVKSSRILIDNTILPKAEVPTRWLRVVPIKPSENCVSVPPKETMKPGLATLRLFDEKHPHLLSTDLINSSPVRINLHPTSGKPEPKTNISYTRYLSLIMEHLLEDKYKNDDLLSLKPHNTTTTTFKPTLENEVALIAHMCKVVALSPYPIKSLLPPSREVNANDIADKSSSRTSVQPVTQSKAPTVRKPMKKKIPSSTQPKALQTIRESSLTTQVAETHPAEETVAIVDAIKSLDTSKSVEEQVNQPKNAKAEKMKLIRRIRLLKIIKKFQPTRLDDYAQITFLVAEPSHFEYVQSMHGDSDSGLHSMPDDDIASLDGFESLDSADQESNSDHQDTSDTTFNASAEVRVGHLQGELHSLNTKVDQLESSISKTVADEIKSSIPSVVVDTLKAQLLGLLTEALKALEISVQKPMNKQFNAFNTLESHRFVTLQKELSKVLKTKMGKSVKEKVRKGMEDVSDRLASVQSSIATNSQHVIDLRQAFHDMIFLLESAEVFKKANAEGEKWEKNNLESPAQKENAQNPDPA